VVEFTFSSESPSTARADMLVLPVFEGPQPGPGVKDADGIDLMALYGEAKLSGKRDETLLVPNPGVAGLKARSVLLVGLGPRVKVTSDTLRRAIGKAAPLIAKRERVATTLAQAAGSSEDAAQAVVEGLLLGSYRFDRYKSHSNDDARDRPALTNVEILGKSRWDRRKLKGSISRGQIVADAVAWARDLVNTPALDCTPDYLAMQAQAMAKEVGLGCKIWSEADLKRGGFGGILGVGQGSVNPPRLIELSYAGARNAQPIALTGKGISFDSGGLSIKDATGMEWMKADMAGAAAMLATMRALGRLKPKLNVIAAIPSSENMPSGSAIRPGDVLRHRGGKTSEVLNTDAEGRLVLADALAYLSERKPKVIIDAATLTGACMIALGEDVFGVLGNDRRVVRDLLAAAAACGEPGWELPMHEPYRQLIDSTVADVKNVGKRWGGAITAALFLAEFVDGTPWAHLDIAGPGFAENAKDYAPKGGTGVPVRTLVRYLLDQAEAKPAGGRRRTQR